MLLEGWSYPIKQSNCVCVYVCALSLSVFSTDSNYKYYEESATTELLLLYY